MKGYCFSLFLALSLFAGCNKAEVATTAKAVEEQAISLDVTEESAPQAEMHALANVQAEVDPKSP